MGSVSEIKIDMKVDRAIDQLDDEKTLGIALSEYARTIVDRPENYAKIANSFAGHAVHLQNNIILRELRLWCCRVWDKNGNSLTLLGRDILRYAPEITNARRKAHPDWQESELRLTELPLKIKHFSEKVAQESENPILAELKIFRDEHLAHLLLGISGATRSKTKSKAKAQADEGYSYNDVLKIVDLSVDMISEAIFLWRFHVHDDAGTRKTARKYYEAYWRILPNLSEAENEIRTKKLANREIL